MFASGNDLYLFVIQFRETPLAESSIIEKKIFVKDF